jgi:outer membrane immunogenic protein
MKKLLTAIAALGLIGTPAFAADMAVKAPPPAPAPVPIFSWTGAYVGLFAGYGWAKADATEPFDAGTGFFYNFGGNPYSFDADGFFGGGTLGYNWQSGAG